MTTVAAHPIQTRPTPPLGRAWDVVRGIAAKKPADASADGGAGSIVSATAGSGTAAGAGAIGVQPSPQRAHLTRLPGARRASGAS